MTETKENQEQNLLAKIAKEQGFSDYHKIFEEFPYYEAIEQIKHGTITEGMCKDIAMLAYFSQHYFLRLFPLLDEENYFKVYDGMFDERNYRFAHMVSLAATAYSGIWECGHKEIRLSDVYTQPNPKLRGLSAILLVFVYEVRDCFAAWSALEELKPVFEQAVDDFNKGFGCLEELYPEIVPYEWNDLANPKKQGE